MTPPSLGMLLAWRPFLDPIDAHGWWFLLVVPMSFGIAVVYRAVRMPTLDGYWKRVLVLTAQIVVSMILLGIASYLFVQVVVPALAPMPD